MCGVLERERETTDKKQSSAASPGVVILYKSISSRYQVDSSYLFKKANHHILRAKKLTNLNTPLSIVDTPTVDGCASLWRAATPAAPPRWWTMLKLTSKQLHLWIPKTNNQEKKRW